MRYLPRSIVLLLLYMAFLFNIERLDIGEKSLINIHGFTYIFITLAVLAIIWLPYLRRQKALTLIGSFTVLYVMGILIVFNRRVSFEADFLLVRIAELALLTIAVLLAHTIAFNLEDFIKAVEYITFTGLRNVQGLQEAKESIETELYRSRRYKHPLTVVLVEPEVDTLSVAIQRSVKDVQSSMMERYVLVSLMTRALNNQLRRSDIMMDQWDRKRFVIMLPETEKERSAIIIKRIADTAKELGVSVTCGAASFPRDALTFDGLLEQAEIHSVACSFLVPEEGPPMLPLDSGDQKPN